MEKRAAGDPGSVRSEKSGGKPASSDCLRAGAGPGGREETAGEPERGAGGEGAGFYGRCRA